MKKRILAVLLATMFISNAWAEDKTINITAQDMPAALHSLASQTGIQLLFTADDLKNIQAKAISGSMSVEEALKRLLEGTNYTFRASGSGTYVLQRVGATLMLHEVTVTATRTERSADEVPANVSVITSNDISNRNVDNVQDLLRSVESIEAGQAFSVAQASSIDIRGVGGSYSMPTTKVLVDGVGTDSIVSNVQGNGGLNFVSPWDVEQVEVLRGPASALYGPEVIGGVVNLIPKRWKGDLGAEVHAAYGSHNTSKTGVAVGAAKDVGDFRVSQYNAGSNGFISQTQPDTAGGMISVDIAPRDWKDRKTAFNGGLRPSDHQEITASYQDFTINSFTQGGHPNQYLNLDGSTWMFGYRHDFGETATIKTSYRETRLQQRYGFDNEYAGTPGDLGLWAKGAKFGDSSEFNIQADWHINADNLLITGYNRGTGVATLNSMFGNNVFKNKSTIDGIYLQDEARFGQWSLILGGRQDHIRQYDDTKNGVATNPESSVSVFNPRLGVQYQWTPDTSIYASAGTAYVPATNGAQFTDADIPNPNLKPEKSTSYEVGSRSKQSFGDMKVALFHTNYQDKINRVQVDATPNYQNQNIDRVEVNGLELGWKGRIADDWSPLANYSYTDSRIKADTTNPTNVGTRMPQTSAHKLNVGVVYSPGSVWSTSLMGSYRSDQYVRQWYCPSNNTNTYECHLGGYFTADAKVSAFFLPFDSKEKWSAWLAVNNLTGKKYRQYFPFEYSDGRTLTIGVDGKF